MSERGRFFGAGPRIVTVTLLVAVALSTLAQRRAGLLISPQRPAVATILGWCLLVLSLALWVFVIVQVRAAWEDGALLTDGVFAHVRHPIYAAFIFLTCPAVALLAWSWPMLALPFVAYAVYRGSIGGEEARLAARFGPAYAAYRGRVPALVPRLGRR